MNRLNLQKNSKRVSSVLGILIGLLILASPVQSQIVIKPTTGLSLPTTLTNATPGSVGLAIIGASGQTANLMEWRNNAGTAYVSIGPNTLPGSSNSINFLTITGTLPSSTTEESAGGNYVITSAGSDSDGQRGLITQLLAGYTGPSGTSGLKSSNAAASIGVSSWTSTSDHNQAIGASVSGTTTGHNVGLSALAANSSVFNAGSISRATGASALNLGIGANASGGTLNVGGFFGLGAAAPTLGSSAALIADNYAIAADIFQARDNGTSVFTIADTGIVTSAQEHLGPVIANCTTGNVAYSFTADTDTGFTSTAANTAVICANATAVGSFSSSALTVPAGYIIEYNGQVRTIGVTGGLAVYNTAGSSTHPALMNYFVEVVTTTKTSSVFESREVYTNTGDTDGSTITLADNPTIGQSHIIAVVAAQTVTVLPSAGETLFFGGTSCATSLTSSDTGAGALIVAVTGGSGAQWNTIGSSGTWVCTP